MAKAPLEMLVLKDYFHSVYYDSSNMYAVGEEDPNPTKRTYCRHAAKTMIGACLLITIDKIII